MRQVLSISLPSQYIKKTKLRIKKRGFDSVSSYIKHLIDLDEDLISEDELWESIQQGRKEYKEGRAITAKSMAELL